MELYRKWRPTKLKQIKGQEEAISVLRGYAREKNCPHALLFTGPSGCGKTTICRCFAPLIGVGSDNYKELDAAAKGGIEVSRAIRDKLNLTTWDGGKKMYVIDEAHELTRAAQEALLKSVEECPDHAYIVLCTTDPKDLIGTIKTRFTEIKVSPLDSDSLFEVIKDVTHKEKKTISDEVAERIVEVSDGSARFALNVLGKVLNLKDESKKLDVISKTEARRSSWDLVTMLMGWGQRGKKSSWAEVKRLLDALKGQEEPERIRRTIVSCLANECMRGGKAAQRAAVMFEAFRDDYYTTGWSGLVFSCYACCPGA